MADLQPSAGKLDQKKIGGVPTVWLQSGFRVAITGLATAAEKAEIPCVYRGFRS